jgi:hypothetical protein
VKVTRPTHCLKIDGYHHPVLRYGWKPFSESKKSESKKFSSRPCALSNRIIIPRLQPIVALFPSTMDSPTSSSMSEKQGAQPEPKHTVTVNIRDVDVAAGLDSDKPLDPDIAARIRYVYP